MLVTEQGTTWEEEVDTVLEDIIRFGFSIPIKDIRRLFLDELGLNTNFPQERGKSIRDDVVNRVSAMLLGRKYRQQDNLFVAPQGVRLGRTEMEYGFEEEDILHTFEQLPPNVPVAKLWTYSRDYARSQPSVTFFGVSHSHMLGFYGEKTDPSEVFHDINFQGQRVIELGPGNHPQADEVFRRGAISYVGVDPFVIGPTIWKNRELVDSGNCQSNQLEASQEDSLGYLLSQPDNSASIISFYVQLSEMLVYTRGNFLSRSKLRRLNTLAERYKDELAKNIVRILPKNGIVFHSCAYDGDWNHRYKSLGLIPQESIGLFLKPD